METCTTTTCPLARNYTQLCVFRASVGSSDPQRLLFHLGSSRLAIIGGDPFLWDSGCTPFGLHLASLGCVVPAVHWSLPNNCHFLWNQQQVLREEARVRLRVGYWTQLCWVSCSVDLRSVSSTVSCG